MTRTLFPGDPSLGRRLSLDVTLPVEAPANGRQGGRPLIMAAIAMVAMNSGTSERLALLSNTAMLKNVLEKDNGTLARHQSSDKASLSHYDPNSQSAPMVPRQGRPMSPRAVFSGQDRESLSPHVVSETRRDSPPSPFHRSDHKQQFHRFGPNGNFRGQSDYPPFPPLPHSQCMQSQPPPDRFFRENRTVGLAPLAPQPDHQPRMQMDMIVGQSFRSPYEDRRAVPVQSSARRLPPDHSGRTMNYYSPPLISVSDDCDDTSERQQQPIGYRHTYESLARENYIMREQLHEKDSIISSLQQRASQLEAQINELRQLPTGKISHIPIEYV